ncbi:GDP-L-fucose synthase [Helicobacter sp.]|uniref:GDP-L-fucose synthase family protein n=1 Tax=Helicobacter sp. TaxID=218 RepID=UPI0025BC31E4|nr:GDP-L-fucose synthase [Helicobacter sp.]MCI5632383.1 GDP-L-fucose synthase [Helicobacter sp.]
MHKNSKIYIAGHKGLVGSAIKRQLESQGYTNLIYKTHKELDLINAEAVLKFFATEKPEYVILAAAKVGGILANNTYRADFIYQNLQIQNNIIHNSYVYGVKKLLFLGSTCIYPKDALQPIKEEYLLTNTLEYTNEPYAIAKIAGLKMCESYNLQYGTNFISVMPTNLYGINDNFDLENSHVLPALLRKIHLAKLYHQNKQDAILQDLKMQNFEEAKNYLHRFGIQPNCVEIWGSGNPRREFLYADDMANACVFIMQNLDFKDLCAKDSTQIRNTHINIGTGEDISIKELALLIKDIVGFEGEFKFNTQKPDGTMLKRTDISKLSTLGWNPKTSLREGIRKVYESYVQR